MPTRLQAVDTATLDPRLQPDGLAAAYAAVRRVFPPTPLVESRALSRWLGRPVWLKLETVTPIRAFKVRGALAKAAELESRGHAGGLVTASAGNHGLAVAFAGRRMHRTVTVFVPEHANPTKVAAMKALGADVVLGGHTFRELADRALPFGERTGGVWVHPFDDPAVMAGQSTVGQEIAQALPEVAQVVVPVGGGGLASGIALALLSAAPSAKLVGVQMAGADAMLQSLAAGRVVTMDKVRTIADGLAPGTVSDRTLAIAGAAAEFVRLSDDELYPAMRALLECDGVPTEPSAAAGVAAVLSGQVAGEGPVVVVVTGANFTMEQMARVMNTPLPAGLAREAG